MTATKGREQRQQARERKGGDDNDDGRGRARRALTRTRTGQVGRRKASTTATIKAGDKGRGKDPHVGTLSNDACQTARDQYSVLSTSGVRILQSRLLNTLAES